LAPLEGLQLPSARLAERALFVLAGAAWVAKVAVVAGAPRFLLTAALLATAAAAIAATRAAGARWIDGPRLALVLLALWIFPSVYGRLGGDGFQYYALLRSPAVDHDLDLANDFAGLGARPVISVQGEVTSRAPIGLALLWLPPFLLVHATTAAASAVGAPVHADGFGPAYQAAVTSATYVYGVLALVLLEALLRPRFGRAVALLAVLALWLATPMHFYMVANPFMSHAGSAFAATVFVAAWLRARETGRPREWALAGLAGGLMGLVRVQDAVLLALPLADVAFRRPVPVRAVAALVVGPVALGLLQALVWTRLYGFGFAGVVMQQNLVGRSGPHLLELMFSARHGLFTWTPLFLLAALGWLLWLARDVRLGSLMIAGFFLAALVNSAMLDWWGGEAYGQRRMLGLFPLFGLGLGAVLHFVRQRPLVPLAAILAVLALWNLKFEYVYNSDLLASKSQAVSLDALAGAQADALWKAVASWETGLPRSVWVLLYENVRGVWLDEGPRSLRGVIDLGAEPPELPLVVGHNWYEPAAEGETTFRRSKGRRSWLRIPIRTVGDFDATLRLRAEQPELSVTVQIEVNGQTVGETTAPPAWGEYAFSIPASALHPGLNDVALVYSASPRADLPGFRGKDASVAVDFLRLRRTSSPPL
jgi:hypothetical protein